MNSSSAPASGDTWRYKQEFRTYLIQAVPDILKTQDPETGRFGSGIWIVTDQNVLYPLAAAWSLPGPDNPHYHNASLLKAIMDGGDALIEAQNEKGMWIFRKKDNSTWGDIYMPWTYSRWLRAYGLIRESMPPERRARWEKALELGFDGIARTTLTRPHNIPAHHAMALYHAGVLFNRPDWKEKASAFMKRVAAEQDPDGYWSEHSGPVVGYNFVYADAVGTYYAMSGDAAMKPVLERVARFHANLTYPNGTAVETVDERQVYGSSITMPNVGFTFSSLGRGYVHDQWQRNARRGRKLSPDLAASFLLYGMEGDEEPSPSVLKAHRFVLGGSKALFHRAAPWYAAFSAYTAEVPDNRWIQDRQNLLSLFHDKTGLILGGGNTKKQPLWSTFSVGNVTAFRHTPGEENPVFLPPKGVFHVPTTAALSPDGLGLNLRYGIVDAKVRVELISDNLVRLVFRVSDPSRHGPVAAHIPILPRWDKAWQTASGREGTLGARAFALAPGECGLWFELDGIRFHIPATASVTWPALPHNPYVKAGGAKPAEGRVVITIPFSAEQREQFVIVEIRTTPA